MSDLGKPEPGIFISKIPRMAIPLKHLKIIIRSDWATGTPATRLVEDMLVGLSMINLNGALRGLVQVQRLLLKI